MHSVSLQIDTHILHYLLFLEKIPGPGFIKRIDFFLPKYQLSLNLPTFTMR